MKKQLKCTNKKLVEIDSECKIGNNVILHGCVFIKGSSVIGDDVEIYGNTYIFNSEIGPKTKIIASIIEDSKIGKSNSIGPFTRIRPGSITSENVKLGNFVEVKNSKIGKESKAAHLSYIGDADVGENVNVGCGAIFVNYDGKHKNRIKVGNGAFIGSNCNLIAPLTVEEKTYICAGTTLTESSSPEDFIIGRVKPTVKEKRSNKYLK